MRRTCCRCVIRIAFCLPSQTVQTAAVSDAFLACCTQQFPKQHAEHRCPLSFLPPAHPSSEQTDVWKQTPGSDASNSIYILTQPVNTIYFLGCFPPLRLQFGSLSRHHSKFLSGACCAETETWVLRLRLRLRRGLSG